MSGAPSENDPIDDLIEAYLERHRRGERPSLAEYTDRHPELAARIRELFPALLAIEEIGSGDDRVKGGHAGQPGVREPMPRRLGDYLLVRPVGSGGMGIVYEAVQESLGRRVALKTLAAHHFSDPTRLERFRREARAAARLHHTHIVPVYGIGEHDGLHFYTMQFIRGHGLDAVLREVGRLKDDPSIPGGGETPNGPVSAVTLAAGLRTGRSPMPTQVPAEEGPAAPVDFRIDRGATTEPDAASSLLAAEDEGTASPDRPGERYIRRVAMIGACVAEALEYAHQQGVLHRDVKPANLLLDAQGQVWITDFGLAKTQDGAGLTRTGDIVGTLKYMAPERFNGWSDPRSDVYALGATLYEMLTLRPAFDESDRVRLIERVLHEEPAPLRRLDRRIPRDLDTIVLKAMAKEPGERYPTAGRLAEDLRRFVAGRPILARRTGAIERSWRWGRRNPWLAGAAGLAAGSLAAVAVIAVLYAGRQREFAVEQFRANRRITDLADELRRSLAESNRLLAIRNFDRGQAAFEKGLIGTGLLWMIESWRSAIAARDPAWQRAARANMAAWQPDLEVLEAVLSHDSPVVGAVFSPDGKAVLTASDDGTAQLWDTATARPFGEPLRHRGTVFAVAWSPDGRRVVTGGADGSARIWDMATGRPAGAPMNHDGEVRAVAWSPDGKVILSGGADHTARLWDAATGRPIGRPLAHSGSVVALAFHPDGRSLIAADSGADAVRRWDVFTGRPLGQPMVHHRTVWCLAFSPDGQTILTGAFGGMACSWDASTGERRRQLPNRHESSVRTVAFSPDGKTILTGGTDKTARLWDAETGLPIGSPFHHQGPVVAVGFRPDGHTMLTASSDGTVRLWKARVERPGPMILQHEGTVSSLAFSPDGTKLATASWDGTARRWDATTGRPIGAPMRQGAPLMSLAFSPEGKTIATGSGLASNRPTRPAARLWDAATGRPIGPPLEHEDSVSVVAFSPDGETLLTAGQDKVIRFWDARTGAPAGPPLAQPGAVDGGAFSPDGRAFVAGYDIGKAQIWDVSTWTPLGEPFPHPGAVSAVAFSPDGKTLLTGCEDSKARIWDVERRKLRLPPLPSRGWIFSVAFSPDGKTVLTASREDGAARLWDAGTGMPLGPPMLHPNGVNAVAFSPDGRMFATGSYDRCARLFPMIPEWPDDLDRIADWVGVLTGLSLDATQGSIRVLDNSEWLALRGRAERLTPALPPRRDDLRPEGGRCSPRTPGPPPAPPTPSPATPRTIPAPRQGQSP